MELELIRINLENQTNILNKILTINQRLLVLQEKETLNSEDKKTLRLMEDSLETLFIQLDIINNSLPDLINNIKFYKTLDNKNSLKKIEAPGGLIQVKYKSPSEDVNETLTIKKEDESKFLKNLTTYNGLTKKLDANKQVIKINPYIILANKLFKTTSIKLLAKGNFPNLKNDLRSIASTLFVETYLSLMLLFTSISFLIALFLGVLTLAVGLGIIPALCFILIIPLITFMLFYIYPSSQKKTLEKEINQELPFMTIYLSAVSTSGIEPSKMFDIIVASEDYPFIKRELKKLTNYINFYGYDLVSALRLVSKTSPSERLSQLLDGFATTITTGGDITVYLNKHAESLLFDYRLERERYTHLAETFMNIYISVVIAAPMILLMLFILMSLVKMGTSLSIVAISAITVLIVSLLNLGFLMFLNLKQPKF